MLTVRNVYNNIPGPQYRKCGCRLAGTSVHGSSRSEHQITRFYGGPRSRRSSLVNFFTFFSTRRLDEDASDLLAVTTIPVAEQDEVSRAVHWLQSPLALLDVQFEHIIRIVLPVTGLLPEADVVHVRGLDLLVAALAVLGS